MSKPIEIKQKQQYEYNGDKGTCAGPIKVKGVGASYEIKGTVGRYLPHELELLDKPLFKNKNSKKPPGKKR